MHAGPPHSGARLLRGSIVLTWLVLSLPDLSADSIASLNPQPPRRPRIDYRVSSIEHPASINPAPLAIAPPDANGWRVIRGESPLLDSVVTLEASRDLRDWLEIAVLHPSFPEYSPSEPVFAFADPGSTNATRRFYRFRAAPLQSTNDWKNQIHHLEDYFLTSFFFGGNENWVKFIIVTNDPTRVFYGSSIYPFHYDFAAARLEPFRGVTPAEFDRLTSYADGRRAWLGSVLYPRFTTAEYGIQFVSQDVLPPEQVRALFQLVKSTVNTRPGVTAFYIPTLEQFVSANANAAYFASNGIPVSTSERWARGDICYSEGWNIGPLKFFSAADVNAAYADGRLRPEDILLTDGIPAELPYLSGIISLVPATANSHVAILARSYGVPFVYLIDDVARARVMQWIDREVLLQTGPSPVNACKAIVVPLDTTFDPALRAQILSLRAAPPIQLNPKQRYGAYTTSADALVPADIRYFGGKAANYGLLRRTIPDNAPVAIAISFDLWDDFMDQVAGNRTLRQEISNRLARFTWPPDVAALNRELAGIRDIIRDLTQFTLAQRQAITNALSIFDSRRNIRFRSSTNVEDAESFSGAGLYASFSGCLADDLDADNSGPSICDPTETGERGVFRAIRRVFASFYNDNAFLERLRHHVDENTVGMAILVHHSTPDDIELANGVATLTPNLDGWQLQGRLVTQKGAVSVANPDGTAVPEEVGLYWSSGANLPRMDLLQFSSLLPRGDHVLAWQQEYYDLADLLTQVRDAWEPFASQPNPTLDFEYKKVSPGWLEIKQIREIPTITSSNITPYLLNQPVTFVPFQGYYAPLWATHRLKSRWTINTRNIQLTETNLADGLFTELTIEHLDGTNVTVLSGPIDSFPNATHAHTNLFRTDAWTMSSAAGAAALQLAAYFNVDQVTTRAPFKTLLDFSESLYLEARYPAPVLFNNNVTLMHLSYVTNDLTFLRPLLVETTRDALKQFTFHIPGQGTNVVIHTSYWIGTFEEYGERPPLKRFVETRIEGFTTQPIVLRDYWSQTFSVVHRGGSENFIFEPRLEPGLPAAQLNELTAADIASFYLNRYGWNVDGQIVTRGVLKIVGANGAFRTFSDQDFGD